ncbi:hypothetical protein Q8F55_009023 [Vanrija albida]|uniref:C2H2-type domain-containing protein n=1 Tax=Vanrija albida TaxID=181172 RepID=A0ABR3PSR1_9TREE
MIRRGSRFDPMGHTAEDEDDAYGDLGTRHPLRKIREDAQPERNPSESVSLPGIKALLNAADQPPLVSPYAQSFFTSPSVNSSASATSPLGSPTSRTSRFSSFASSVAEGNQGWWAPEERSHSFSGYPQQPSRSGSFSARVVDDDGPDVKRRRSDLAPTLPDADEVARLKWQAQSRNASYPATGSMSTGSSGLRSMLYPPPSGGNSRGSVSGPLSSPLSPPIESPFQQHYNQSRQGSLTGPLARSFADLSASERSPSQTVIPRTSSPSPLERRPSLYSRNSQPNESIPQLPSRRTSLATLPSASIANAEPPQRGALTRPPSPEPSARPPRRSSLAELIMAKSGDDIAIAKGGRFFTPPMTSATAPERTPEQPQQQAHQQLSAPTNPSWLTRRESTDSVRSSSSMPGHANDHSGPSVARRRSAIGPSVSGPDARRSFALEEDELADPKSDPGMRGMEVLAESARRVADAERKDSSEDRDASPSKPSSGGPSSGPKYACQYCAKTFSRPSSLRIHTYSHTGERPFVCKEPSCRRRFSVQSNLKRHAKVHQLQAQQAAVQMGGMRGGPPGPHQMHPGPHPGATPQQAPPPQHVYGYPPHQQIHPSHMGHGPHGPYGPPPHSFGPPGPGGHPGPPGFEMGRPGPQGQHFAPVPHRGGAPPGHDQARAAHYHEAQRRRSHDEHAGPGRSGQPHREGGWGSEEEDEDELDDDDD